MRLLGKVRVMKKENLSRLCFLFVLILLVGNIVSIFNYKQMYNHGASWLFRIIVEEKWTYDDPYYRFSSFIPQTPAVLAAKFSNSLSLIVWLYNLGYLLYPFVALGVIYCWLKKYQRIDLIYPLILSLFLCIVPTWAFSNAIVGEAVVIFWFIYTYIMVSEKPKWQWLMLLGAVLLFSYEVGMIFYALASYLLWREKKLTRAHILVFASLTSLQLLNLFIRVLPHESATLYSQSFQLSLRSVAFYVSSFTVVVLILAIINNKWLRAALLGIEIVVVTFLTHRLFQVSMSQIWTETFTNRTWVIPMSFLTIWAGYEFLKSQRYLVNRFNLVALMVLFVPSIVLECKLGIDSYYLKNTITSLVEQHKGCYVMSLEEQNEAFTQTYSPKWGMPYISIIMNDSFQLDSILFADYKEENKTREKVFCEVSPDGRYIRYTDKFIEHRMRVRSKFDYSKIFESIKK